MTEDATRRKLLPNAAMVDDDDDEDDAGTQPDVRLTEDDDAEEVEWSEVRCGVGMDGTAAAGDAVGRRMRRGDLEGAEPKKVRAPPAPSLMMGDWRA